MRFFDKISLFAFDVKRYRTWARKYWIGKAKGFPKSMKFGCQHASKINPKITGFRARNFEKSWNKRFQKWCFFRLRFFIDFGRVWGGFWDAFGRGFGACWPFLGGFLLLFLSLCAQEGLRGPKRRPRALLSSIWVGFGGVLGGVWEDLGGQNWGFSGFFCTCRLRWHKTA